MVARGASVGDGAYIREWAYIRINTVPVSFVRRVEYFSELFWTSVNCVAFGYSGYLQQFINSKQKVEVSLTLVKHYRNNTCTMVIGHV